MGKAAALRRDDGIGGEKTMAKSKRTKPAAPIGAITFATFRIAGDKLAPGEITELLSLAPTTAYAKGETYDGGRRGVLPRAITGVWHLSTQGAVASDRLSDHLLYLTRALVAGPQPEAPWPEHWPAHLAKLRQLIEEKSLYAVLTCVWQGEPGAEQPAVPPAITQFFKAIPADVATEFAADEEMEKRAAS